MATLKLFKFTQGLNEYYGAYGNAEEAYERRAEVDHTFHYTDVRIEEVTLEGYEIAVYREPGIVVGYNFKNEPDPLPFADDDEDIIYEVVASEGDNTVKQKKPGGRPRKVIVD